MHEDDIFALTPRGEAELRSSATLLAANEMDVLLRFDGLLALGQVRALLPPSAAAGFAAVVRGLRDRGLLHQVELDPLTLQFQEDLKSLGRAIGKEEADAGLASLQRTGFYVQIARGPGETAAKPPRTGPWSVVLVEDDLALAHFTRSYLMLSGFQVRTASTRAEVVAEIRKPPRPDLILLDVMLPDVDGFEILMRVRQHPVLQAVPVIMLTGKATRAAVIKGLANGADGYITKPFEPEALMRAVGTVLGVSPESFQRKGKDNTWTNADSQLKRATRGPG